MVDLQCMVSYIKWSRVTKSGDFLTIENGVTKEYPFLLEMKVFKSLYFSFIRNVSLVRMSQCQSRVNTDV